MTCYQIDGIVPVVDPTAYVHPSAVLRALSDDGEGKPPMSRLTGAGFSCPSWDR